MRLTKKSKLILASAAIVGIVGSGVAYAYWTNSGTGTGTAATGTNVPITLTQTSTVTAMAPGIAAQALSGTFDNTNAGPVFIKTVVATVTATGQAGCTAADYTIAGTSVVQGAVAGAGAQVPVGSEGTWSGLTIAFNSTASNQDACKNAVVTVGYTTTAI